MIDDKNVIIFPGFLSISKVVNNMLFSNGTEREECAYTL